MRIPYLKITDKAMQPLSVYGCVGAVSNHLTGAVHRRSDETLLKDPAPDEPVIHNLIVALTLGQDWDIIDAVGASPKAPSTSMPFPAGRPMLMV